jgi:hypothetical protein
MKDLIERQAAIDILDDYQVMVENGEEKPYAWARLRMSELPSAQPEIVRCKDCKYGEQDEVGRWFCSDLGCQIGSKDGSGFCADAERRTDEE